MDHYKTLGIEPNATLKQIKKQYRELAKKHHPDANQGNRESEEFFKTISAAYTVLVNKRKRLAYDRSRAGSQDRPRRGAAHGRDSRRYRNPYGYGPHGGRRDRQDEEPRTGFDEPPPSDPGMPTRGFDLNLMIDVPFPTAMLGGKVAFNYDKYVNCLACQGTGGTQGDCPACEGKRQVIMPISTEVDIPPGIADRFTLRLHKQGGEGRNGGPPGDLLLQVCILPHPRFKRIRDDVLTEVEIFSRLAETGGPLTVQTLDATQTVHVEDGTLTGEEIRIPGQGAAIRWGKRRGDLIVRFRIAGE